MEDFEEGVSYEKNDTFIKYVPFSEGEPHPSELCEAATLAFVNPPQITYTLKCSTLKRSLSAPQLDAVVLACQSHEIMIGNKGKEQRQGFFVGDKTGVGKGRICAGIIAENVFQKREKSVWISCSMDLMIETIRDLGAMDLKQPFLFPPFYSIIENNEGTLFTTYTTLLQEAKVAREGVSRDSRFAQLISWLGTEFDGPIIFDECHAAKRYSESTMSTLTGDMVVQIQSKFPKARIVYASATGVSKTKNLAYMTRLGVYGPGTKFPSFESLLSSLETWGVTSLEMLSIDLKMRGLYLSRQLSFKNIHVEMVYVEHDIHFRDVYDRSSLLWALAYKYLQSNYTSWRNFGQFWSYHQMYFRSLILASKTDRAIAIARSARAVNKSVIIGMQTTGEAQLNKYKGASEFSLSRCLLKKMIVDILGFNVNEQQSSSLSGKRKRTASTSSDSDDDSDHDTNSSCDEHISSSSTSTYAENTPEEMKLPSTEDDSSDEECDMLTEQRKEMFIKDWQTYHFDRNAFEKKILNLYKNLLELPRNPIDTLLCELGGPREVAELTGRNKRQLKENGAYEIKRRGGRQTNNIERQAFMEGGKQIVLLSDACSTGISLHCDPNYKNKNKRLHLTLEFPWSAEKMLQQLGRSHRAKQVEPPEYKIVVSNIPGEMRFISTIQHRMELMGALTNGDRSSSFDFQTIKNYSNEYAKEAIQTVVESIAKHSSRKDKLFYLFLALKSLGVYVFDKKTEDEYSHSKQTSKPTKFYNRTLGLPVWIQEDIFRRIEKYISHKIEQDKDTGDFDHGVRDLVCGKGIKQNITERRIYRMEDGGYCSLLTVSIDKSLPWNKVATLLKSVGEIYKFYKKQDSFGKQIILARNNGSEFFVWKPNSSTLLRYTIKHMESYKLLDDMKVASKMWKDQYDALERGICIHTLNTGKSCYDNCNIGKSKITLNILSGCLLSIMDALREAFPEVNLNIIRLHTSEYEKIVGILIPDLNIPPLIKILSSAQLE